jgi:hypothetical protein
MKRVLPVWLLIPLALGEAGSKAHSIAIGFSQCLATTNYSQSLMDQIGQCKFYFAHASVGACMMEGVGNLHLSNTNFYRLHGVAATNSPPATTQPGAIYEDYRGNPLPYGNYQAKLDLFRSAVSNGWHFPTVNIALAKLCYIDIWYATSPFTVEALLEAYVNTVASLEADHPQTVFAYATMPLTTTNYRYGSLDFGAPEIYWRNIFNDNLRAWCSANDRVLLDIADIEAHDYDGNLNTFVYNNRVCEQLWWWHNAGSCGLHCADAGDGAHPTNVNSEKLMARAFYALAAATMNRWKPPPVIRSFIMSGGTALITWDAVEGHAYRLQFGDSPASTTWTDASSNVVATGPIASATHSFGAAGATFYRVRLVD